MAQPTAFQAAQDLIAYNGETELIVGCGTIPGTHPGAPHRIPLGNPVTHADILIPIANAYTMDIDATMTPHRIGSFWIEDHTEDLPPGVFQRIFFENLPGPLFGNRGWCLAAARAAHRLLAVGGQVIIRSGMGTTQPNNHLDQALQDVFGPNAVGFNVDQHGVVQDIRATK